MAIAFVQGVSAQGASVLSVTTGAITTTSGNLLIIGTAQFTTANFGSVSDSKTNTLNLVGGPVDGAGSDEARQYAAYNCTGGASHTFTQNCSPADFPTIIAAEVSGIALAAAADKTTTGNETGTTHSTGTTAALTQADELVYCNGATHSVGGSISNTDGSYTQDQAVVAGAGENAVSAYKIVAATTAVSWNNWTIGASRNGSSVLVTYKAAAASGVVGSYYYRQIAAMGA
jgi:hypothetical protein